MKRNIDEEQLVRYVAGECTDKEAARIRAWMQEDPARRERVAELEKIWEAAGTRSLSWNVDAMWDEMVEHMDPKRKRQGRDDSHGHSVSSLRRREKERAARVSRHPVVKHVMRVAAVVAVVAVTALVAVQLFDAVPADLHEPSVREIKTDRGQRANVRLDDGTRVRLNVDSKLTLPASFAEDHREVRLEGEAFFEVAPDAERPFLVRTEETLVRVVGTRFNVRSYAEEPTRVVVTEGRVAMRTRQQGEAVPVAAGHVGRLDADKQTVQVEPASDVDAALAWMDGRLVFEDTPLRDVAEELERWYDLQVHIADPALQQRRLTAQFKDESLREILAVVASSLDLRYERDRAQQAVTFSHP